jgi:PPM family protein phosphatase
MKIILKSLTKKGSREINEDFVASKSMNNQCILALADGLGGHGKGEVASKMAVETSIGVFETDSNENKQVLEQCFEDSQKALTDLQNELSNKNDMKTTLVLLYIYNGFAQWGHIGDSRLYVIRDNKIHLQTLDHSVPQALVRMGEIQQKDIRNHADRNKLLRVLGTEWEADNPRYEICEEKLKMQVGDKFLLATDGFWELITEKQMMKICSTAKLPSHALEEMEKVILKAGKNSNMDNYSAILMFVI